MFFLLKASFGYKFLFKIFCVVLPRLLFMCIFLFVFIFCQLDIPIKEHVFNSPSKALSMPLPYHWKIIIVSFLFYKSVAKTVQKALVYPSLFFFREQGLGIREWRFLSQTVTLLDWSFSGCGWEAPRGLLLFWPNVIDCTLFIRSWDMLGVGAMLNRKQYCRLVSAYQANSALCFIYIYIFKCLFVIKYTSHITYQFNRFKCTFQ